MKTIACFLKINYKDNYMHTVCDNICIMFMELSTQKGFFFFCFFVFVLFFHSPGMCLQHCTIISYSSDTFHIYISG